MERLILAGVRLGLLLSLGLHLGVLATLTGAPAPPWSWAVHAGAILGFWCAAGRISAAGLRGVAGLLRIRRMLPIPVRLLLGAATLNALVDAGLAVGGAGRPGRAITAYWIMMYLLVWALFAFVILRLRPATPPAPALGAPPGRLLS